MYAAFLQELNTHFDAYMVSLFENHLCATASSIYDVLGVTVILSVPRKSRIKEDLTLITSSSVPDYWYYPHGVYGNRRLE